MRFDRALIAVPAGGTVDDAVTFATRLVRPGARLTLRPDPTPADASPGVADLADLDTRGVRLAEVAAALRALGFDVVDAFDEPPEVVALPCTAPRELVATVLAADRPVALLAPTLPPVRTVAVVAWNEPRRVRPVTELLVDHPPDAAVHLVSLRGAFPLDGPALCDLLGLSAATTVHALGAGYTDALAALGAFLSSTPVELLATMAPPRLALGAFLDRVGPLAPGLLLVPGDDPLLEFRERLELFAAVEVDGAVVTCAATVDTAGRVGVADDRTYVAIAGGRPLATVTARRGQLALPPVPGDAFGLVTDPGQPAGTLEATAPVLRPDGRAIVLVPADLPADAVARLRGDGRRIWAVATTPCSPAAVVATSGVDAVLHAGAVLRDGGARDVPAAAAAAQRARVARTLRALGFPVVGVVDAGPVADVAALSRDRLGEADALPAHATVAPAPDGLAARLVARCEARPTSVASLAWQPESRAARERLLELIGGARRRVHLQSYIFLDDPVGRAVADALREAAGRGVQVRVVVDSLWSRHGSLRLENPVLDGLSGVDGLELRLFRPVGEVADLRRRSHRKLLLVDGEVASVAGRNVAASYYTGLDEVALTPTTPQEAVPWLDLSTEVRGPVVDELERLFAETWAACDGTPYEPDPPSVARGVPAFVVAHRGLEDAATLDAWRALFDAARARITIATTFPVQHELQHALLERLAAGVSVRVLTGHVRPRFQGGALPFPGAPERDLMTELVHGRLDPLAEAGADVRAVGVPPRPGWDPALGVVLPHVHAKCVLVDGELAGIGSANLDLSSAYWEDEVLLVVRDRTHVAALERELDALAATSRRFDPADPDWRRRAAQRAWISENWPGLLS
jgi:cardiolipin synthase